MDQDDHAEPGANAEGRKVRQADAPGDGPRAGGVDAPAPPEADRAPGNRDLPPIPEELPILAVRDAVVFPGTIMPLGVERPKSRRLVESALRSHKMIGVVAQIDKDVEDPGLGDLYRIGTVCVVLKLLSMPDGAVNIIIHGLTRFGLEGLTADEPFMTGRIHIRPDPTGTTPELDALLHNARQAAYRVIELSPNIPDEARTVLDSIDTPGGVADFLAANLSVNTVQRQELLETFDVAERLVKVNRALAQQLEVLELSSKIQQQVREQIDRSQREYFLHEQLKAIQKELGESDSRTAEIEDLRRRARESGMPEPALKEAQRELDRMLRIPQASPEYSVALDYVSWLCDLPWTARTADQLDLRRAERILDEDHHDLEKVKKRILEFLAVRRLKPDGRGPILCFLGPPGVGKTSLGQSIARALGRKFIRMSLGGLHDEAQLRGHRRTYIGAMPGRIIQEIRKAGSNNPVFMLDEVDKIGQDFRGDPASALLEILDPQQNHSFTDNYLDVAFDLSGVMFIATANYLDPIPAPLRDRMELLTLSGYTLREKLHIARRYLVPRQLAENGLTRRDLAFSDAALRTIIESYTREAGVRGLEREIGAVARAVAARRARGRRQPVSLQAAGVEVFLGPRRFEHEAARRTAAPGVVTGVAFTPTGGDILFVEAAAMPGSGRLRLTGQLGAVMKESAQAAFSLVRSRAEKLGVDARKLARTDIHIHVPAGAVPKDGPSAGVSMFTAMVSLLTGRPCRPDVAMTGEITLTGRVLPIGGVKEKVLAAHRAGIRRVILPEENRKDLVDIPADVRRRMTFRFAAAVEEVLKAALGPVRR